MAALDPNDRMATVDKAYQFEKVQTALQEALNNWESATKELELLQNQKLTQWLHENDPLNLRK